MSLLVIAHMASPLCGDAPMLDAVLEGEMAQREGKADRIRRDLPLPDDADDIHIPMLKREIGGWNVPCCSSPVYGPIHSERVEHVCKRLSVENADQLAENSRLVVATGNSTFKSYRLPMRIRHVGKIAWLCEGHRRPIKSLLRSVNSLGKKRSIGYGRVSEWTLEEIAGECHWFAPNENGVVLMRPLPFGDWLPKSLIGYRRDFGGVIAPYWHPERLAEIVVPC